MRSVIAYMPRKVLVTLALWLIAASVWAQNCADIRRFNFKSAAIHVVRADENELQTLFSSSRDEALTFRLRNGVALAYDDPALNSKKPDWRAELVMDREVHPEPAIWIRVIGIDDDHMTGTGTWRYILAFSCEKGHLVRKFQFTSEGVALKYLDNQTLQLTQLIWAETDSHADPSGRRELTYNWDTRIHKYRLAATNPGSDSQHAPDSK